MTAGRGHSPHGTRDGQVPLALASPREVEQRWQLAQVTAEALLGWQPEDEPDCVLEGIEAVAVGRAAEPGVVWSWRQGPDRFHAQLTVLDLVEAMSYEEWPDPPPTPAAEHWTGLIGLTVYEPHGQPPGAPSPVRWCLDYLP